MRAWPALKGPHKRWMFGLVASLLLLVATTPAAWAQGLRGTVVDSATSRGIGGARLTLSDRSGQPVATGATQADGSFSFTAVAPDAYVLVARSLGYRPLVVHVEYDGSPAWEPLRLVLVPLAVELDPIVVEADAVRRQAEISYLQQEGFYKRTRRTNGRFLDPEYIDRRRIVARRADDFLAGQAFVTNASRVGRRFQLRCGTPRLFIDDREFYGDDFAQAIDPEEVLAIEVYDLKYESQVFDIFYGPCAVVLWTREPAQ